VWWRVWNLSSGSVPMRKKKMKVKSKAKKKLGQVFVSLIFLNRHSNRLKSIKVQQKNFPEFHSNPRIINPNHQALNFPPTIPFFNIKYVQQTYVFTIGKPHERCLADIFFSISSKLVVNVAAGRFCGNRIWIWGVSEATYTPTNVSDFSNLPRGGQGHFSDNFFCHFST